MIDGQSWTLKSDDILRVTNVLSTRSNILPLLVLVAGEPALVKDQ